MMSTRWILKGALATIMAGATLGAASAQNRPVGENIPYQRVPSPRMEAGAGDGVMARSIEMGVGRSIVVDLPRDAKEVFVANPAVANAVVRTARKLFIIGVANGATTIMALDADGKQIAALEMQIGREPGLLQQTLKTALPHADIRAVSIGDSIILTGQAETVLEAQKAVDIANGFVGRTGAGGASVGGAVINSMTIRGKDQVMLKVTVAEVKRTAIKQLGVNINGNWEIAGKTLGGAIENQFTSSLVQPPSVLSAGAQVGTAMAKQIDVRMLERQGVLRTLAEPTLTAISGETAKFVAGGEIPVPKSEEQATNNVLLGVNGYSKINVDYKSSRKESFMDVQVGSTSSTSSSTHSSTISTAAAQQWAEGALCLSVRCDLALAAAAQACAAG